MQSSLDAILVGALLPERIATRVQVLLASSPDPGLAIHFLERLRQQSPAGFDRVCSSPAALRCAIHLFSYSVFLSECVLRNPELILEVANSGSLYRLLSAEEYENRLFEFLGARKNEGIPPAVDLARFRRAASCCASCCATCSAWPRSPMSREELSNLADAILDVAYRRIREDLVRAPRRAAPARTASSRAVSP